MNTKEYVASLFRDYEETAQLKDFMEELQSNLDERIASLIKKGSGEDEAFERASGELGDISDLADEISLKRRQEVFEDAYMGIRKYMKPSRIAAYIVFGAVFFFGLICAAIIYFGLTGYTDLVETMDINIRLISVLGALMFFTSISVTGFTFLGVTQETAARFPMSKKRALWYAAAAFLLCFGIMTFPIAYIAAGGEAGLISALGTLIAFVLPSAGIFIYLILTEKDRSKTWIKTQREDMIKSQSAFWNDPVLAAHFGMISGAIWIFAMGFFIFLGLLISFKYSWLVFVFATAIQLLVQALMTRGKK